MSMLDDIDNHELVDDDDDFADIPPYEVTIEISYVGADGNIIDTVKLPIRNLVMSYFIYDLAFNKPKETKTIVKFDNEYLKTYVNICHSFNYGKHPHLPRKYFHFDINTGIKLTRMAYESAICNYSKEDGTPYPFFLSNELELILNDEAFVSIARNVVFGPQNITYPINKWNNLCGETIRDEITSKIKDFSHAIIGNVNKSGVISYDDAINIEKSVSVNFLMQGIQEYLYKYYPFECEDVFRNKYKIAIFIPIAYKTSDNINFNKFQNIAEIVFPFIIAYKRITAE